MVVMCISQFNLERLVIITTGNNDPEMVTPFATGK